MKKFLKNHKGVTMVEVLLTVAMLAIVVAPCLSAFVVAQRGNVLAKQTFDSYTVAANLIEELKSLDDMTLPERLDNEEYTVNGVKINDHDGVYVIYEAVNDSNDTLAYYVVWIYNGEDDNYAKNEADVPEGYILKGVITP